MSLLVGGGIVAMVGGVLAWLLWSRDKYLQSVRRQRDDARADLREVGLELAAVEASRDRLRETVARQLETIRAARKRRDAEIAGVWDIARKCGNDVLLRRFQEVLAAAAEAHPDRRGG